MSEELNTAVMLLGVGMITVFIVLSFVVVTGKLLIAYVNKFVPILEIDQPTSDNISSAKIVAITSAIEVFTKGKGKITNIKKL